MFCSKCGNELQEGQAFCPKCGEPVAKLETPRVALAEPVHPAGSFMWSVAIGGPIAAYLVHRKELKTKPLSFFWPMVGWNILVSFPCRFMDRLAEMNEPEDFGLITTLSLLLWIVASFVIGKIGAKKIKEVVPEYPYSDYKKREWIGIVVGLVLNVPFAFV